MTALGWSHMNPATKRQPAHSPAELLGIVKGFLDACRTPIAVEPGLQPVRIEPGSYALEEHRSGCVLHVWGGKGATSFAVSPRFAPS